MSLGHRQFPTPRTTTELSTSIEQLRAVASRLDVPYVSILASLTGSSVWMGQVEVGDGAHPSGEGYAVLADLLWPAWTDWLAMNAPRWNRASGSPSIDVPRSAR